jgi:nucleoside-diphosphate-sugar epimerase
MAQVSLSDSVSHTEKLGWAPSSSLTEGLEIAYRWVAKQILAEQQKCAVR